MLYKTVISENVVRLELRVFCKPGTSNTGCWNSNTCDFKPDQNMVGQRKLIILEECINRCNEEELCLAVVVSPSYWAYRECFRVSVTDISFRAGWSAAYKSCFGTPPPGYYSRLRGVLSCFLFENYWFYNVQ